MKKIVSIIFALLFIVFASNVRASESPILDYITGLINSLGVKNTVRYVQYTNSENTKGKNKYEIKNGKIFFSDNGRFSNVQNYTINEKYVSNDKIIRIINNLLSENSYTAVYYVPSEYTFNQIIIKYGENEESMEKNTEFFSLTYYEDKLYDLGKVALREDFSHKCYLKINLKKMWTDYSKFKNNNYIDDQIKEKLINVLEIEFGDKTKQIVDYILEQYENGLKSDDQIARKKQFGKFIINAYRSTNNMLDFYIEEGK